jgi:hypothetical protein
MSDNEGNFKLFAVTYLGVESIHLASVVEKTGIQDDSSMVISLNSWNFKAVVDWRRKAIQIRTLRAMLATSRLG